MDTKKILDQMLEHDAYSKWLGIEIDDFRAGYCKLHYTVRPDMVNGFKIIHGGVLFSAADSAFAFACNISGQVTVALDVHISFIKSAFIGDVLTVEARQLHAGNRTGVYDITTTNQAGETICVFRGTSYKTSKALFPEEG